MEQVTTVRRLDELFASFPLRAGDAIWLVGGNEGLQVQFFLEMYPGVVFNVYEPQPVYVEFLKNQFRNYPVQVHPYALGDVEGKYVVGLSGEDCTFHWKYLMDAGLIEQPTEMLQMEDIAEEFLASSERPYFLMMNCEGSELEIIKRLSETGWIKDISCVLAQIHFRTIGFEGCQEAYDILSQTHEVKWRYNDWSWVYAERR